ncbi:MAG TPA: MFS transporter [Caulobacteraceae bacterium]|jgi:MFS family permease|nr:MFS transporter [Caulobacteraceae bacterium]
MAFFGNDAVNRVNLHFVIQAFASNAGGVFLLAFLLRAGFSPAGALTVLAGLVAGRFVMRPLILPIGKRWGLKPLLIAGTLGTAVQYPLLGQVHGLGAPFWTWVIVSSAASTLYWPTYHAYFSALGDAEHRGHQVGIREAASTMIGVAAPLVGAWLLLNAGALWMFGVVGAVQALSVAPLLGAPNVMPPRDAPGIVRAARAGVALMLIDGWQGACIYYVWQVALFVSLAASIGAYGGAVALAALVGAVLTALFGRHIDRGGGRRTAALAGVATLLLVLIQAAAVGHLWWAVVANALVALANALIIPAVSTPFYNLAQASPCTFRYNIAAEGAWDVGCGAGALAGAGIYSLGGSLSLAILMALPAVLGIFWMLWRYYGAHPSAGGVEIEPALALEPHATP